MLFLISICFLFPANHNSTTHNIGNVLIGNYYEIIKQLHCWREELRGIEGKDQVRLDKRKRGDLNLTVVGPNNNRCRSC